MSTRPLLILDTNVVLDCFVFQDGRCRGLVNALEREQVRWVATAAMQSELEHVLARRWADQAGRVAAAWARCVELLPDAPPSRFVCTDADDQKFIDLAVAHRVRRLLTRDRALLKLARRARLVGVEIGTPERWEACAPETGIGAQPAPRQVP